MESAQKTDFAVEWWPIGRPKPYPKNARKWSAKAVEKVAASIREFRWRQPLVCDASDVIIIGHLRLAAAQSLGLTEVPVHVARDLSPAKVRALRLADNRLHEEAAWDEDLLRDDMLDMRALDLDMSMTGFESRELDRLLLTPDERADECPEVPKVAITRPGDLWLMGEHRLLCGDATKEDMTSRLMNGDSPTLLWTDPPYGVDYAALVASRKNQKHGGWTDIAGDSIDDRQLMSLLSNSLGAVGARIAFVWHPAGPKRFIFWEAMKINGWQPAQEIIWVKNSLVFGRADYQWRHEPCIYARRGSHERQPDRTETTVWEINKNIKSEHPTQKPVALCSRPIMNHTISGDLIFDPFLGSGTAIIAAEETGRRCSGLEIEPLYCDVIVQRWQNFTGREATLEGDGRTFAAISAERTMVTA